MPMTFGANHAKERQVRKPCSKFETAWLAHLPPLFGPCGRWRSLLVRLLVFALWRSVLCGTLRSRSSAQILRGTLPSSCRPSGALHCFAPVW